MGIPQVDKFLCCLELKVGALVVGVINLVGSIILAIVFGLALLASIGGSVLLNSKEVRDQLKGSDFANLATGFAIAVTAIGLAIFIFYIVVASLLIHGARTENACMIMPWLILTVVGLIYDIVLFIQYCIAGHVANAISSVIGLGIGIYVWLCIYSFRKQILGQFLTAVPKN